METESTIKNLENLRDDFYKKYRSIEDTLRILKGEPSKEETPKISTQLRLSNDGYDPKWPMKNKLIHVLKRENRFLHIRQIGAILHEYEKHITEKDFISKLYPAMAILKKSAIVKVTDGKSNTNTFWGSKNWLESDGIIKKGHEYDSDQIRHFAEETIEI